MRLVGLVCAAVLLFMGLSFAKFHIIDGGGAVPRLDFPNGVLAVAEFSPDNDLEWLRRLKHAPIVACVPFEARDAFADKWIVFLEGGYKAMFKLFERRSLFDRALRTVDWDPHFNQGSKRAESGGYQAMPELVAWYLDRLLGFYRKPPMASRVVSSKVLYPSFWTALLPAYDVHVSVHAWVEGLHKLDPPTGGMRFMVTDTLAPPVDQDTRSYLLKVSDILVFDFLVDDHDRQAEKNWIQLEDDLVAWDNGLGWNHGPFGEEACLDILCGSNRWRRATGLSKPCQRICIFREETVQLLKSLGPGSGDHQKLSRRLRNALLVGEPLLFPMFDFGVYYSDGRLRDMIRYESESFFEGMDGRVQYLLTHIDTCVRKHGQNSVILPSQQP